MHHSISYSLIPLSAFFFMSCGQTVSSVISDLADAAQAADAELAAQNQSGQGIRPRPSLSLGYHHDDDDDDDDYEDFDYATYDENDNRIIYQTRFGELEIDPNGTAWIDGNAVPSLFIQGTPTSLRTALKSGSFDDDQEIIIAAVEYDNGQYAAFVHNTGPKNLYDLNDNIRRAKPHLGSVTLRDIGYDYIGVKNGRSFENSGRDGRISISSFGRVSGSLGAVDLYNGTYNRRTAEFEGLAEIYGITGEFYGVSAASFAQDYTNGSMYGQNGEGVWAGAFAQ